MVQSIRVIKLEEFIPGKKIWLARLGSQSNLPPYNWLGFQDPVPFTISCAKIKNTAQDLLYDKIYPSIFNSQTFQLDLENEIESVQLFFEVEEHHNYYNVILKEHQLLGFLEEECWDILLKNVRRVIKDKWSGTNNVQARSSFLDAIQGSLTANRIMSDHVEWLI